MRLMLLYYVFIWFNCLTSIIGDFWRIVRGLVVFGLVAFPLKRSRGGKISLVLRFLPLGYILGGLCGFRAIVGGFGAFGGVGELAAALPLALSRSARGRVR